MDNVNKTLYIPLYGKAYVSHRGIILKDEKAEEIWAAEGFPLRGKAASKWLAYYMGMRAAVFDRWAEKTAAEMPEATVLHLGCGMDSRVLRVNAGDRLWYDADFPQVIEERKRYYGQTDTYRMAAADLRESTWLEQIPGQEAVVILEGVSMYLQREELRALLRSLTARFSKCRILMDVYTEFAARASKYKNPINEVGVTQVYGLDDPLELTEDTGMTYLGEHTMTPENLISQLTKGEQVIFRKLYAGQVARKLYRLHEYGK